MAPCSFRTFDEAFAWLAGHTNYETMATQRYDARAYGLDRVTDLLRRAGDPHRAYDVAQVLGSKGKGSAAAMLAAILQAAGRRTGLYSSPHLVHPRERIRIDGQPADDALVRDALEALRPLAERATDGGAPCTFFEIHTAAALVAFRAAGCQAVVLEAGMGGRLDATSAAEACAHLLTSISLDHVRQLGRTRRAIAREKAAAARVGAPFVCGEPPGSAAFEEVERACDRADAPLLAIDRDYRVRRARTALDQDGPRTTFVLETPDGPAEEFAVPLLGEHQARNAAVAVMAARHAPWTHGTPTAAQVRAGLEGVRLRARLEVLGRRPLVLLDGAHTPASMSRLAAALRATVAGRRIVAVVGMARDKDVAGSLRRLRGTVEGVIATSAGGPRAATPDGIAAAARHVGLAVECAPDAESALALARRRTGPDDVIVVTGSLYLCGAVLGATGGAGA